MNQFALGYAEQGYVVIHGAVSTCALDEMRGNLLSLVQRVSDRTFDSPHSPEFACFMNERKDVQSLVYEEIRKPPWLVDFSREPGVVDAVRELLGGPIATMRKIPLRIDAPLEIAQYAVWHQDQFYVRGNLDIITAWVPLQKTTYVNGCLSVMPGSHKLGPLAHDINVLGKRDCPVGIYDREIRLVEMEEGDALLFHSCLLHSSGLNVSDVVRFSIQSRYTRRDQPTDPGMGGTIDL